MTQQPNRKNIQDQTNKLAISLQLSIPRQIYYVDVTVKKLLTSMCKYTPYQTVLYSGCVILLLSWIDENNREASSRSDAVSFLLFFSIKLVILNNSQVFGQAERLGEDMRTPKDRALPVTQQCADTVGKGGILYAQH